MCLAFCMWALIGCGKPLTHSSPSQVFPFSFVFSISHPSLVGFSRILCISQAVRPEGVRHILTYDTSRGVTVAAPSFLLASLSGLLDIPSIAINEKMAFGASWRRASHQRPAPSRLISLFKNTFPWLFPSWPSALL